MQSVLIIDDETDFCLLLKNFLVRKNYEVYLSHTLTEGMKMLEDLNPDILFLDNNLPDGLGWEKTEYIVEKHAHTRINLISAYQYNTALIPSFPAVKIWEKPISMRELNNYLI
jgi:DNA-binding response OmpR family regulator